MFFFSNTSSSFSFFLQSLFVSKKKVCFFCKLQKYFKQSVKMKKTELREILLTYSTITNFLLSFCLFFSSKLQIMPNWNRAGKNNWLRDSHSDTYHFYVLYLQRSFWPDVKSPILLVDSAVPSRPLEPYCYDALTDTVVEVTLVGGKKKIIVVNGTPGKKREV